VRRALFALAAAVSLLLCVTLISLWVRSYRISDLFTYEPNKSSYSVYTNRGETGFQRIDLGDPVHPWRHYLALVDARMRYNPPESPRRWAGFFIETGFLKTPVYRLNPLAISHYKSCWYIAVVIPYWAWTAAALSFFAFTIRPALRRVGRTSVPRCACGYNLTGSTSGVCPECGTKISN